MKIKNVSLLLLVVWMFASCSSTMSFPSKRYKEKYVEFLDQGSKFISADYNSMVEYSAEGKYVKKYFYPDTKQITHYTSYADKSLKVKDGWSKEWWDNGDLVFEGKYKNNFKEGEWKAYLNFGRELEKRIYKNGRKVGLWKIYDEDGNLVEEVNYESNKKNGAYQIFNKKGELIEKGIYKNGEIVEREVIDKTRKEIMEVMPEFKGCESIKNEEERVKCAEKKMLVFIYSRIKYPSLAREQGLEGMAYVQFFIDKNGELIELNVLRGICKEIKNELLRIFEEMPDWHPGKQNGKSVKVKFTLPVSFKLM